MFVDVVWTTATALIFSVGVCDFRGNTVARQVHRIHRKDSAEPLSVADLLGEGAVKSKATLAKAPKVGRLFSGDAVLQKLARGGRR